MDSSSLGSLSDVTSQIVDALPGTQFAVGPAMPQELLASMSEEMREALSRPKLEGLFEHEDYVIQFYGSAEELIPCLHAEVRGGGDPASALRAICDATGWSVWDDAEQKIANLSNLNGWQAFCEWRDKVLKDRTESK